MQISFFNNDFLYNNMTIDIFACILYFTSYEEFYKLKYCSTVVYMVPRA